jgi:hypothetical protein
MPTPTEPTPEKETCVSEKPWGDVLNRSAKLAVVGFFQESGRSVGRFVFIGLTAAFVLVAASFALDHFTGWLSAVFDFWPFNRAVADVLPVPNGGEADTSNGGWFGWGQGDATEAIAQPAPEPATEGATSDQPVWYCRFNPIC